MEISRGAIAIAAGAGEFTGKPRPYLVIQSDVFAMTHASLTMCPITSVTREQALFRVDLPAGAGTGLLKPSQVQVDKISRVDRADIVQVIGQAPPASLELVDQALRRWLAL